MTNRNLLYGWKNVDADVAIRLLADALQQEFVLGGGDYVGGDIWRTPIGSEEVIQVQYNFVDEEGLHYEEEFPEYSLLVEIAESRRWDFIEDQLRKIEGLDLLRLEVFE
ncbi:hypothetical protein [Microbispora catharanthi]|uniref:Uncharacterized protein n=1 Tax=Microbispora catharanthi TaxID=1712871 RepID=A0A5N6C4C8_9ACTN|nr:hypothetical protein [Microbispora catharanthi]KAB8187607.1 hypothetical protein FH610_000015 [Microbispora catharanthi]